MELEDDVSNKRRKIEETKEEEALLPLGSTEEEKGKDSATCSFDTALQEAEAETAVIDTGAAVIDNKEDNKEDVVLEEGELSAEGAKAATYTNPSDDQKKSLTIGRNRNTVRKVIAQSRHDGKKKKISRYARGSPRYSNRTTRWTT